MHDNGNRGRERSNPGFVSAGGSGDRFVQGFPKVTRQRGEGLVSNRIFTADAGHHEMAFFHLS